MVQHGVYPHFRIESLEHLSRAAKTDTRILITGASGWIGRTLALMCQALEIPTMLTASKARVETVGSRVLKFEELTMPSASKFRPTVVFDCAFITPEYIPKLGLENYRTHNLALIDTAVHLAQMDCVSSTIFCGSGAGAHIAARSSFEGNPYGFLKRETEVQAKNLHDLTGKQTVVMRPWSVSGVYCTKQDMYAFSSFINGARKRQIQVMADRPTLRRYVSLEDLIAVTLFTSINAAGFNLVESGGQLVELGDLGNLIASLAPWDVEVISNVDPNLTPSGYFSDNVVWSDYCRAQTFTEESLNSQIVRNLEYAALWP